MKDEKLNRHYVRITGRPRKKIEVPDGPAREAKVYLHLSVPLWVKALIPVDINVNEWVAERIVEEFMPVDDKSNLELELEEVSREKEMAEEKSKALGLKKRYLEDKIKIQRELEDRR